MAVSVDAELKAGHEKFKADVIAQSQAIRTKLAGSDSEYLQSYKLICAFRAWHEVALNGLSADVVGFFIESHNDLLTGHVHAMNGMNRSAFIALRSFMENYLSFVYFLEHPVELVQWKAGELRLEPKNLRSYCLKHPSIKDVAVVRAAAARLDSEYAKLSGSVHGSKVDFRMTSAAEYPTISTADTVKLKQWRKLETQVVRTALIIFLGLFRDRLRGAAHPTFRKILAVAMTPASCASIKSQLAINL